MSIGVIRDLMSFIENTSRQIRVSPDMLADHKKSREDGVFFKNV
jgi:hypothetical protein